MNAAGRYQVMPPLSAEEYDELEADIVANGVLQPVLVDENDREIDGHHRRAIAAKHGLRCPTVRCPPNLSDEQKRTLALGLNVHRRHLTREQKRDLIARSLVADPQLSDRQHAERTGSHHSTVGAVRGDLESTGEISQSDERLSADGRTRPASQPIRPTVTETHTESRTVDLGTGEIVPPVPPAPARPEYTRPRDRTPDERRAQEELEHAVRISEGLRDFLLFRNVIDTVPNRADFIANYSDDLGRSRPTEVSPNAMRQLAAVICQFASEWEEAR